MAEQPNDGPDAVGIRAEIEETRTQMSDTLDEIGERLRPSHIKQQIGQGIHDATVGRVEDAARHAADSVTGVGRRLVDVVRDNPIPAAMIGIGLSWLFLGGGGQRSSGGYSMHQQSDAQTGVRALADRAGEVGDQVADRARDVANTVRYDAREGARLASDQFRANPLAMGAAAVAIGVAAGLAIPATRQEQELMGEARDRLVDRAKDVATEAKEKLQTVAERTIDQAKTAATDAAREEGLTQ
jgi:hypothetical protein